MPFAINAPSLFNFSEPKPNTPDPIQASENAIKLAMLSNANDPRAMLLKGMFDRMQAEPEAQIRRMLFEKATGETLPTQGGVDRTLFGTRAPSFEDMKSYAGIQDNRSLNSLRDSQAEYYRGAKTQLDESKMNRNKAFSDFLKGMTVNEDGTVSENESGILPTGDEYASEDYSVEPVLRNVQGIPVQMNQKKLKPAPAEKAKTQINSIRSVANNLTNNLSLMTKGVQSQMYPLNPLASRGFGDFLLKGVNSLDKNNVDMQDFTVFKAETDKVFQQYRKDTTGAQAALKELGWLEPDYPNVSDAPKVYIKKTLEAVKRYKEAEQMLLDVQAQGGSRVSQLRAGGIDTDASKRQAYNTLRASGMPIEEAKKQVGL